MGQNIGTGGNRNKFQLYSSTAPAARVFSPSGPRVISAMSRIMSGVTRVADSRPRIHILRTVIFFRTAAGKKCQ